MKAAFGWLSRYFSRGELLLWGCSMGCILLSFAAFDRGSYLTLAASLIGATSLRQGQPGGAGADDPVQPAVRAHFLLLCLLRRDAHLSGHDRPHGCGVAGVLAAQPLPGQPFRGGGQPPPPA